MKVIDKAIQHRFADMIPGQQFKLSTADPDVYIRLQAGGFVTMARVYDGMCGRAELDTTVIPVPAVPDPLVALRVLKGGDVFRFDNDYWLLLMRDGSLFKAAVRLSDGMRTAISGDQLVAACPDCTFTP